MKFVFWQDSLSIHQAPWLAALAALPGASVQVIAETGMLESRRKMGWAEPDYGRADVNVGFTLADASAIIGEAGPQTIHTFSGLNAYRRVHEAFLLARKARRRVGILSERPPASGVRAVAARMKARLNYRRFRTSIDFLLAIGDSAGPWFARLEVDPNRLFQFAYFPPLPCANEPSDESFWPNDSVRLLFIGELTFGKGIDRLLRAIRASSRGRWQLCLVGAGPGEASLKATVDSLGFTSQVRFIGSLPYSRAMSVLKGADVLVLPSRIDGYGSVVNEALYRGVPVICSSEAGACQALRDHPAVGSVFSSEDVLSSELSRWIEAGRKTQPRTERVMEFGRSLSPECGAEYFLKIVEHLYGGGPRPNPPWRGASSGSHPSGIGTPARLSQN